MLNRCGFYCVSYGDVNLKRKKDIKIYINYFINFFLFGKYTIIYIVKIGLVDFYSLIVVYHKKKNSYNYVKYVIIYHWNFTRRILLIYFICWTHMTLEYPKLTVDNNNYFLLKSIIRTIWFFSFDTIFRN